MPNQQIDLNQQVNQPSPNDLPEKPKFNLKYILIVVILATIVGGGILAYQYWWMPKQEVKPLEITIKDETADWQTYRNEDYGFELKIPPQWANYVVEKEVRTAGSEYVYDSGEKSQFPWAIYKIGIRGSDLGTNYHPEQVWGLITVLVFEASDAKRIDIEGEVKKTFSFYKIIPTSTKYFVIYKPICQDCAEGEIYTELRKYTEVVMETFQP